MKPIGYPALNELPLSYYTQDGDGGRRLYKRINITLEWLLYPSDTTGSIWETDK